MVARYVRAADLDRPVGAVVGDPFEEQGRLAAGLAEEAGLAGRQEDRLDRLAQSLDGPVMTDGEEVVQRAALQVGLQQVGELGCREADLLEEERRIAGAPKSLEEDDRGPGLDAEGGRVGLRRWLDPRGQQARPRLEAAQLHLLREADRRGQLADDTWRLDERAPAAGPLEAILAGEVGQRTPHGDEAAAVLLGELTLRRKPIPDRPLALVDSGSQVEIDLMVERYRAGSQLETCQPRSSQGSAARGCS